MDAAQFNEVNIVSSQSPLLRSLAVGPLEVHISRFMAVSSAVFTKDSTAASAKGAELPLPSSNATQDSFGSSAIELKGGMEDDL